MRVLACNLRALASRRTVTSQHSVWTAFVNFQPKRETLDGPECLLVVEARSISALYPSEVHLESAF